VRARPKSQILSSQLAVSSRLAGLRSRCSTLAVCTYFSPRSTCAKRDSELRAMVHVGLLEQCACTSAPQHLRLHKAAVSNTVKLCWPCGQPLLAAKTSWLENAPTSSAGRLDNWEA